MMKDGREIKFRVWDKENARMSKPFHLWDIESDGGYGALYCSIISADVAGFEITAYKLENPGLYELMQFTGLHDKNGKEIYKGHIVRMPAHDIIEDVGGDFTHRVVVFKDAMFTLDKMPVTVDWWLDAEIVGHILENPELLESPSSKPPAAPPHPRRSPTRRITDD